MDGRRPRCAHCGLAGGPVPTAISPCAGRLRFSRRSASARSPSPSAAGRRTCAGTSAATSPGRKRPSLRSLADVGDPVEPRRPDHQATVAGEEEAAGAPRGRAAHADRRGAPSRISSGSGGEAGAFAGALPGPAQGARGATGPLRYTAACHGGRGHVYPVTFICNRATGGSPAPGIRRCALSALLQERWRRW